MEAQDAGINDIQAERDRVERLRACAEECDTVAKPEDYVFVDQYRLVRIPESLKGADGARGSMSTAVPASLIFFLFLCMQVRPYHFDFLCGVKQRHVGLGIVELFCKVWCFNIITVSTCTHRRLTNAPQI
jgi:hypothetical protein